MSHRRCMVWTIDWDCADRVNKGSWDWLDVAKDWSWAVLTNNRGCVKLSTYWDCTHVANA